MLPVGWARSSNGLLHEAPGAAEVGRPGIDGLDRSGRLAGVEAPGLAVGFVEQGKGAEHGMVGEHTAAEDHTGSAHEAVGADADGLAVLAVVLQINGMAEQLGVVAGDGAEGPDGDAVGAVDVVILGDGGMGAKNELCPTIGLVGKVGGSGAGGKAGDPVSSANGGPFAQLKGIKVHGHGEGIDSGARGHGKVAGIDPG